MSESPLDNIRVDRNVLEVTNFEEAERSDLNFWRSKTPDERLEALELSRQIAYGYDPTTSRLSRVLEIIELSPR